MTPIGIYFGPYVPVVISALAGFCAKLADEAADHSSRLPFFMALPAALLYGWLGAMLILITPLSSLFLALALAAVLSGKIDHPLHWLGVGVLAALLLFGPMRSFDLWPFVLFFIAGLLDELELPLGPLRMMGEQRLWAPFAALGLYLWDGEALFLLAILGFDIAYRTAAIVGRLAGGAPRRPSALAGLLAAWPAGWAPIPGFASKKKKR